MGLFVISKQISGNYYFMLKAGNGQAILTSEEFTSRKDCLSGIEAIRRSMREDIYEKQHLQNRYYYFVVKFPNGEVVGTSEMFLNEPARENGIILVKENAELAEVADLKMSIVLPVQKPADEDID